MALIRYLAETRNRDGNRPARRLLLIDEPELYLHPHGVRRLRQALASLAEAGFQVIFSTHSPLMLSRDNAADTVIVGKSPDVGVTTQKPLRHAVDEALSNAKSQSRTLFELSNLAEVYFAGRVVLCEGKTDRRLLPLVYERLYQQTHDLDHIAFVSVGGCANIPKALPVLAAMGIRACAVADLDFAYTYARTGGLLDREAPDMVEMKRVLSNLQLENGFMLVRGLPQKDRQAGWSAADVWSCFAVDDEGRAVAADTHEKLKHTGVWVWPQGCIEQVTSTEDKGEDAIIEQEERLREMSAADIEQQMPAFKACFDWIRGL